MGLNYRLRLIRKELGIAYKQSLSPVVLTSMLGNNLFDIEMEGYLGTGYSITQTSQVYLDNKAYETAEGFVAEWDYVEQLFDANVMQQMHDEYCSLIESLAEVDWEVKLPELILSDEDMMIIQQANSAVQPEVTATLVDLCLDSMRAHKNKIAVIDGRGSYLYKQIEVYSACIAHYLYKKRLTGSLLIAVFSEKGYQQVIATLGIMQSGAAYLPIQVGWPIGRILEVLQEGSVKQALVSRFQYQEVIKGSELASLCEWFVIEDLVEREVKMKISLLPKVSLDDVAYVIFTSGSTGKPKGVTISHRGAVNTLLSVNNHFGIDSSDKVLALSELSFDLSVYDIFGLLAVGGTIVFPDQDKLKKPDYWAILIQQFGITIWDSVPQLAQLLFDYIGTDCEALSSLKVFLLSGDWIPLSLPGQIKNCSPDAKVQSLGGATEGSIWSIWYEIETVAAEWASIPYGVAMPNQKMYVLNAFAEPCPIGVVGEIYIGGTGVGLGYWQEKEKTEASFVDHSCLGRLYKTGDLGRWHRKGYLIFEGRKDNQVKLNGYRVELDEIAVKLTDIEGIDKALATVQDNQVVVYWVSDKHKLQGELNESEDSIQFKLQQKGIREDVEAAYWLENLDLNEASYRLRKSYRQFKREVVGLNKEKLLGLIDITDKSNYSQVKMVNKSSLSLSVIKVLLQPLSAIQLTDKALPKYLYPSGGSSYAIQCNLTVIKDIPGIKAGNYYYQPVKHYLAKLDGLSNVATKGRAGVTFEFKLYLPAIEPLYQAASVNLAWLEFGHILALFEKN